MMFVAMLWMMFGLGCVVFGFRCSFFHLLRFGFLCIRSCFVCISCLPCAEATGANTKPAAATIKEVI